MLEETNTAELNTATDQTTSKLNFDFAVTKKASRVLRSLNHKLRQQMLNIMDEKGNVTVTEIFTRLSLEQSVASQHLAILRDAGIVSTEREGKFVRYAVNYERLNRIGELAALMVE